jgi:uncharacterized membrane protein YhaH (DUF805 family)
MSDRSEGPGWWLASDGKWYPPESRAQAATGQQIVPADSPFDIWKRRAEFWWFSLVNFGFIVALGIVTSILGSFSDAFTGLGVVVYLGYVIGMIVPSIAVIFRRLHDTDKSGAMLFLLLLPFIGSIILFVFYVIDGDRAANRYGPSPKYQA